MKFLRQAAFFCAMLQMPVKTLCAQCAFKKIKHYIFKKK